MVLQHSLEISLFQIWFFYCKAVRCFNMRLLGKNFSVSESENVIKCHVAQGLLDLRFHKNEWYTDSHVSVWTHTKWQRENAEEGKWQHWLLPCCCWHPEVMDSVGLRKNGILSWNFWKKYNVLFVKVQYQKHVYTTLENSFWANLVIVCHWSTCECGGVVS
jgi:hypothetical protein